VPGYQTEGSTVLVECDEGTLEITDDWLRTYHISGGGEAPKGWSKTHRGDLGNAAFNLSPDYGGEGYHKQIADFADAIRQKRPARFDWREGLRIQGVVSALYESVETGNTIVVPDR
jgi:predicted dehydrogenase